MARHESYAHEHGGVTDLGVEERSLHTAAREWEELEDLAGSAGRLLGGTSVAGLPDASRALAECVRAWSASAAESATLAAALARGLRQSAAAYEHTDQHTAGRCDRIAARLGRPGAAP